MNVFRKILILTLAAILLSAVFCISVYAEDEPPCYKVKNSDGGYTATFGETREFGTLAELIRSLEGEGVGFDFQSVTARADITVTKSVAFKGSLALEGDISFTANAVLEDFVLSLSDGSLFVNGGEVRALGGSIASIGRSAVVMDHSARSSLILSGAKLSSESASATVTVGQGTAEIVDSEIKNPYGAAISSTGTLLLGGGTLLEGHTHSVITSRPIYASADGKPLCNKVCVLFDTSFDKGAFFPVVLSATAQQKELFEIYDKHGSRAPTEFFEESDHAAEKCFIAVYMPYRVKFYCGSEQYKLSEHVAGETLFAPKSPERVGYSFCGWYSDAALTERYTFGSEIKSDLTLYAAFELLAPEYSISSLSFVYSKESKSLSFDKLYHPLSESGSFSFVWYKNGEEIDAALGEVAVKNVSDSGIYRCKIGFSTGSEAVFVTTPDILVSITPKSVAIPTVPDSVYTGSPRRPEIENSSLYTVGEAAFTDAGTYAVTLKLTDSENYAWEGKEGAEIELPFNVLFAKNVFVSEPTVTDGYEGVAPSVSASSLFGSARFFTSADGEEYTEGFPRTVGKYLLVIKVDGTANYSSLESAPIPFEILPELAVALKIDSLPVKTEYFAFDKLSLDGARILVTYNSGRTALLDNSEITAVYGSGDTLLVGDRCVNLAFGGATVPITVTVFPRSYDLSRLSVSPLSVTFDGSHKIPSVEGQIVGADGIPLVYTVRGGGTGTGTYTVTVEFSTESRNYETPTSLTYAFTVEPMPIEVVFGELEFVYDGTPKVPTAHATLVTGQTVLLKVEGAATDSGEYTARALIDDKNYTLVGGECKYEIKKALLDLGGIVWSGGELVYNGALQSVTLSGLPSNVKLVGYTDASFTDAGTYLATAVISFDEKNYIQENPITFKWQILAAEYSFGDFGFIDTEAVYDGALHYPTAVGSLPVGFDGSSPSYEFSRGVASVSDGTVKVDIIFKSDSKNYDTPSPVSAFVSILPKKITVTWSGLRAVYDGEYHVPTVTGECPVQIIGKGLNAGEYTVVAKSLDSNFSIINEKEVLIVEKRTNAWLKTPSILNYFTSGKANPIGEAEGGKTQYLYYSDPELSERIENPLLPGTYYMVAYAPESENYLELRSDPIKFDVVKVEPVRLRVNISSDGIHAMSRISAKDVVAYYENNDGSRTLLAFSELEVKYQNADSLRFGDNGVTFSVGGFEYTAELTVLRAIYDMSGVHWENEYHYYDGTEKSAYLTGLPEGITLIEYSQNSATAAGSYKLSAVLGYDTENYYPPKLPDAWLVIEKAKVDLPTVEDMTYNGKTQAPKIDESPLYSFTAVSGKDVGEYSVEFSLSDPDNYEFSDTSTLTYRILPIKLSAQINEKGKDYELTEGAVIEGDELGALLYREDGMVYLSISNPNYEISVTPVKARSRLPLILILIISLVLLLLIVCAPVLNRKQIAVAVGCEKSKKAQKPKPVSLENEKAPKLEKLLAVDVAHADGMISDAMAKGLIEDSDVTVQTHGKGRASVNVDKISEAFSSGDTVDINLMKEKGLVGKDALSVKVLAGGIIDKPLYVRANSFSAAAVKMIALTGGHAYKTKTSRRKNKK